MCASALLPLLLVPGLTIEPPVAAGDVPPALRRALAARQFAAARVAWSSMSFESGVRPQAYTTQYAGRQMLSIRHIDQDAARPTPAPLSHSVLEADRQRWETSNGLTMNVTDLPLDGPPPRERPLLLPDIRAVGLSTDYRADLNTILAPRPGRTFAERREGAYDVVEMDDPIDGGSRRRRYWIDPARGDCVVRLQVENNGRLVMEVVTTPARFGEYWFPQSVEFYKSRYRDGREPYQTVTVESAALDDPALPARLTPEDALGLCNGVNISYAGNLYIYVNGVWETPEAAAEKRERGDWAPDEPFLAAQRLNRARNDAVAADAGLRTMEFGVVNPQRRPGLWEEYVRRFIAHYRLNREQADAAWRIHADCKDRATQHLRRIEAEVEKLRARAAVAASTDMRAELVQRQVALLQPVADVFDNALKPRLEAIPTAGQRAAAADAPPPPPTVARPPALGTPH